MANTLQAATFVLVLTIVAASAASDNHPKKHSTAKTSKQKSQVKCPSPSSVGKDDLLPNPDDCTTYYHCVHGKPMLMPCPAGLHFNPKEQYCDWPWEAGCDPSFDPRPSTTPKTNTCEARF